MAWTHLVGTPRLGCSSISSPPTPLLQLHLWLQVDLCCGVSPSDRDAHAQKAGASSSRCPLLCCDFSFGCRSVGRCDGPSLGRAPHGGGAAQAPAPGRPAVGAAPRRLVEAPRSGCGPAHLRPPANPQFLSTFAGEIQSMSTFPAKTSTRIRFPKSRPAVLLGKSILCRCFQLKPLHRIDFAGADLRFPRRAPFCDEVLPATRFSVDVFRQNLGADPISPLLALALSCRNSFYVDVRPANPFCADVSR